MSQSNRPKVNKRDAIAELWSRGELSWKCHSIQKDMRNIFYNSEDNSTLVWLLARQSGKCLTGDTLVATPNGAVAICDLKPGDEVVGYNRDGTLSPTKVLAIESQGVKEVVELKNRGIIWATATENHKWLVKNTFNNNLEEITTSELKKHKKIKRAFYSTPMGEVEYPYAYTLGALLGDGCSMQGGNQIHVSSLNKIIPEVCAFELKTDYKKSNGKNYTWCLYSKEKKNIHFDLYRSWCKDKKAHQKIIDLSVVKTWNRASILRLMAGLIDTDGSVFITGRRKGELKLAISMQSKSIIDALEWLFISLFQAKPSRTTDSRKKYKNGPLHTIYFNNNLLVKRILKELDQYLNVESKKWKPEYEHFVEYNSKSEYVGVVIGNKKITETFDIQVDNKTHLYLLANGLVTHNSVLLATVALEQSLRQSNSIVKLLTDTKLHAQSIFDPIFKMLLEDCPEHLKPTYIESKFAYTFYNGSSIQLAGSDNKHYERLRGQKSDLVLVDEAGFCDNLNHIVKSILLPTLTHTGGKIVLASTPPTDPDHDFYTFIERAELNNVLTKKTIHDNPLLDPQQVQRIIKEMGGENSPQFRREYLCEVIREEENVLFPEFDDELEKQIVKEWPRPPFFDSYVSMDLGYKDLTVLLFGYYDFRADKVIIEDEIVLTGKEIQLPKLTESILKKEHELWVDPLTGESRPPYLRVSDINYIVTQEISRISNGEVYFVPTKKDDNESALNNLRVMLANKKIIINPRCKTLIRHIRNCKWKSADKKSTFARSPDNGHYDAVDAAKYLVRMISYTKNPYPSYYNATMRDSFGTPVSKKDTYGQSMTDVYKTIFNVKRRK